MVQHVSSRMSGVLSEGDGRKGGFQDGANGAKALVSIMTHLEHLSLVLPL